MNDAPEINSTVGVLASGGPDSCVMIARLLNEGNRVRPFYVRCGLAWEAVELAALKKFLRALAVDQKQVVVQASRLHSAAETAAPQMTPDKALTSQRLEELIVFDLPLADLYGEHWSVVGSGVPGADSPDSAVYLPGRNALLAIKPALWCAMHGVERLALATLSGNPFGDAGEEFFAAYDAALRQATGTRLEIIRPLAAMSKADVLRLGAGLPLELTFSCIAPVAGRHCGRCNKCAERRRAFHIAGLNDPTAYAPKSDSSSARP